MNVATAELPAVLWMASLEYNAHDWLLAAEYGRWHSQTKSTDPTLLRPQRPMTNERYYAMVGYRLVPWLQVGSYYAGYYPHYTLRSGEANQQHDVAATLRFDITPNWLVKLEGHFVHGTAALGAGTFEPNWTMVLLRTTAYF
jgi:predicted porin